MRRSRAQIKPNIGPTVTAPSALEEPKPKEGEVNAPIAVSVPIIADHPSTSSEIIFPLS